VAVGLGAGELLGGEGAVGTGPVLHGDGDAEVVGDLVGQRPGDQVGAAARVLAHEHGDRLVAGEVALGSGAATDVAAAGGEREGQRETGTGRRPPARAGGGGHESSPRRAAVAGPRAV
jgi:hypothetical protein